MTIFKVCGLIMMVSFGISSRANSSTVTVFYQGMFDTQAQASKLVGKGGFIYPYSAERVVCPRAIDCIINLMVYPEIDEVELLDPTVSYWRYVLRPTTLPWFLMSSFSHWYNTINITLLNEALVRKTSLRLHAIRLKKMSLGQEGDLAEHQKRVVACREKNPQADIVLYGVSRGSTTTFTAHALYKYDGVKAVILEGCPSSIPDVVRAAQGKFLHSLYQRFVRYICAHDPQGISALSVVEKFPHDTPVLFITSKKDTVVPSECPLRLADALVKTGHHHVYCLVLENSTHIGYSYDDPVDAENYQSVVHAFYKKYSIAGYNQEYAAAGEILLAACHKKSL